MIKPSRHEFGRDEEHRLYLEGIRLFNEGDFFEAHDTWEEVWHRVQDRRRERFYRGLIQAAVTLELLRRGRAVGVRQVFVSSCELLEGLPPVFMGLTVADFLKRLRGAIQPALDDLAAHKVRIDPARLFTIKLAYDPFADPRHGELWDRESQDWQSRSG